MFYLTSLNTSHSITEQRDGEFIQIFVCLFLIRVCETVRHFYERNIKLIHDSIVIIHDSIVIIHDSIVIIHDSIR